MKPLSQQVREIVQQSQTSPSAIAKAAGINQSAMSRFMNDGSLTMEKLDRLAKVLGVSVTTDVSLIPRPPEKGRPAKSTEKRTKMNKKQAKSLADRYAQDAFENNFSSRRGIWHIVQVDCLLYYNNNPYAIDDTVRSGELNRIEKQLKAVGIKVLARGEGGDALRSKIDAFYTATMLIDCSVDRQPEVVKIIEEETSRSDQEVNELVAIKRQRNLAD
ncbi:MAG TPA: XRE family transcriptional regulator [Rhodopirellula baltica]|uniref:HTH cro/C1-type domain-containing protein n=1 Tax=Rhodopirellula baltica (strain DSM 10527 / NCIMB 13988 / SH1) TaxID=243090 RepID=Q7UJ11_RHOBA|nr:helix-turn-helix transcriptional regulator [Rhodopirellula baltica]CAD77449.1 hypothetical protein RB12205 [Rhodopirellula baltica SH 1]HBE62688.1 XRE family transcriptional regulator [Rhodopirellula baltica]